MILTCRVDVIEIKSQFFQRRPVPRLEEYRAFPLLIPDRLPRFADKIFGPRDLIYIPKRLAPAHDRTSFHTARTLFQAPDIPVFAAVHVTQFFVQIFRAVGIALSPKAFHKYPVLPYRKLAEKQLFQHNP